MNPASGGPCQGIRNSIPELEKMGVHNEVVCLDDPNENFIAKDAFKIYALGPGKTAWCYSEKLIPWLKSNLLRFDVVIIHGLWLYNGYATLKSIKYLQKRAKKNNSLDKVPKLFVMPHGMLDPYFQIAADRKLKAIRNQLYWKFITSKLIAKADGILYTTQTELNLARTTFPGYRPKKELNVGYGIQAPPPSASISNPLLFTKFTQLKGKSYFLFLSRIHQKKGLDILIEAYLTAMQRKYSLSAAVASSNAMDLPQDENEDEWPLLVIAGPGLESNYGKKIKERVAASGILSNTVIFTGMLDGDIKWEAFYNCEAMILPSHQENFGIAVVEALACGKPVLISNQVNTWCEIKENKAGLVADDTLQGTVELFEKWDALQEYEKKEMGVNAGNCYMECFGIETAAKRMYNTLAEQ